MFENSFVKYFFNRFGFVGSSNLWGEACIKNQVTRQIVILPPSGGANFADRSLLKSLGKRGYEAHLLDYSQRSGLTPDQGVHDRISRLVLGEIDQFLSNHSKPTVLIGASLGGLYASMAFSYSLTEQTEFKSLKLIDGVVLVVAGGSLAEILASSDLESIQQQRALRFRNMGSMSNGQYRQKLEGHIFYDPMIWAQPAARERVLMFNSKNDSVIPSLSQEALWRAWGQPTIERLSLKHALSIAQVYFFKVDRIDRFLKGLE